MNVYMDDQKLPVRVCVPTTVECALQMVPGL